MSEIKGQLFGVLLAALVFTLVGGAIYGIFQNLTTEVETKASEAITAPTNQVPGAYDPQQAYLTY